VFPYLDEKGRTFYIEKYILSKKENGGGLLQSEEGPSQENKQREY